MARVSLYLVKPDDIRDVMLFEVLDVAGGDSDRVAIGLLGRALGASKRQQLVFDNPVHIAVNQLSKSPNVLQQVYT